MSQADDLNAWIGREQVSFDEASPVLLKRLAALVDQSPDAITRGTPTPDGWHVAFFAPLAPQSELSEDGHPKKGAFLPPVPYPRRLFAGRRISFIAPILVGADVKRTSRIASIAEKQGRGGAMVLVQIDHTIEADGVKAIEEVHDIIYRPAAAPGATPGEATPEARESNAREPFRAGTSMLFRYSAITYNAHRIHYDQPYTTEVESYPGLVVNGGLIALMLIEHAKRRAIGKRMRSLSVRHNAPFFADRQGEIASKKLSDTKFAMWATDEHGRITGDGAAEFYP